MNTRVGSHDDGIIGIGVLVLMTVALIAGQLHAGGDAENRRSDLPLAGSHLLIDELGNAEGRIGGSLRELRVLPSAISEYTQLDWSSDEELIRNYRPSGL